VGQSKKGREKTVSLVLGGKPGKSSVKVDENTGYKQFRINKVK
jgi:hypothetical protein